MIIEFITVKNFRIVDLYIRKQTIIRLLSTNMEGGSTGSFLEVMKASWLTWRNSIKLGGGEGALMNLVNSNNWQCSIKAFLIVM